MGTPEHEIRDVLEAVADHDFGRPFERCGHKLRILKTRGWVRPGRPTQGGLAIEPCVVVTSLGRRELAS